MTHPVAVTDGTFQAEVLEAETPVLVDFWAEWCQPCKMIAPHLEKIAEEQEGKLKSKDARLARSIISAQQQPAVFVMKFFLIVPIQIDEAAAKGLPSLALRMRKGCRWNSHYRMPLRSS